jgi:hypothetical protein
MFLTTIFWPVHSIEKSPLLPCQSAVCGVAGKAGVGLDDNSEFCARPGGGCSVFSVCLDAQVTERQRNKQITKDNTIFIIVCVCLSVQILADASSIASKVSA